MTFEVTINTEENSETFIVSWFETTDDFFYGYRLDLNTITDNYYWNKIKSFYIYPIK